MGGQGGQRDEQNGAGVQEARPRSIGARTGQYIRVETWDSAGVCGTACMGRAKQEKFWEVRDDSHMEQGQDRELYPILHLIGKVLWPVLRQGTMAGTMAGTTAGTTVLYTQYPARVTINKRNR